MQLIAATPHDLPFIMTLEHAHAAAGFIRAWPAETHGVALASDDDRYFLLAERPSGRDGFAILRGLGARIARSS